jgi:hypothetical protein
MQASLPEKILSDARLAFIGKTNFHRFCKQTVLRNGILRQGIIPEKFLDNLSGFFKSFEFILLPHKNLPRFHL